MNTKLLAGEVALLPCAPFWQHQGKLGRLLSGLYVDAQHCSTASFGLDMMTGKTLRSYAASMCCPIQGRHCHTNDRMLALLSQLLLADFSPQKAADTDLADTDAAGLADPCRALSKSTCRIHTCTR